MERERHKRHRSSDSDADAGTSHAGRDPLIPAAPPDAAVMRAADGNGVHESAETAVGQAASSSGSPLPGALMRKFEGSLGADLGGVRVHTGAASQAAAASVGARAYAVGQDIHFGAGQFDPGSRSGQHLIAHEAAHTVQQASGAARKPMFKLQVSSPGDSHEVEADRAADAMVAGSGALVGSADRGLARAPQSCEAPSSKPKNFLDEDADKKNDKCEMPDPVSNYRATNLNNSLTK